MYEETRGEGEARARKQRRKAERILRKYFLERRGKPVRRETAFNHNVSLYFDMVDHCCQWAFHEWVENEIRAGRMKEEPVTEVVGYNLVYLGDDGE